MLAGELYDPLDGQLVAARNRARDLCQNLNATRETDHEQRRAILGRYAESNEWVRACYFTDLAELFVPPTPGDYTVLDEDGIEARKWDLAASLIFGIAKRVLR